MIIPRLADQGTTTVAAGANGVMVVAPGAKSADACACEAGMYFDPKVRKCLDCLVERTECVVPGVSLQVVPWRGRIREPVSLHCHFAITAASS